MRTKKPKQSSSFTDDCASSWCCLPFFAFFKGKKSSQSTSTYDAKPTAYDSSTPRYTQADMTMSALSEPLLAGDIGSSTEEDDSRLTNSRF